jgi:LacI family transcriptional regulator
VESSQNTPAAIRNSARTVGMKEVAQAAGVSVGTVSNVLNKPDIVSPDRRSRVEAAIAELGYVRNDAARMLKLGRSRTVGAIVLDVANPFYTDLLGGMEAAAEDAGLAVIMGSSGNRASRERVHLSQFEEQRVRGVLLTSVGTDDDQVASVIERGTPVVLVESESRIPGASTVSVDDTAGGALAVRHLVENGRERIAMVFARLDLHQVRDRIDGAQKIEADDLAVLAGRRVGEDLVRRSASDRPDAVFCVNDLLAVGAMQAFVFEARIAVPEDIALIGYDDIAFARSTVVPLTSIAQPADLMGRTALELLETRISSGPEAEDQHVRFTPRLVVRESSGS